MGVSVSFDFYLNDYHGALGADEFGELLEAGVRHVEWVTNGREPAYDGVEFRYKMAVCSAVDAFAEYGQGQVGGFSLGDLCVTNYENAGTTGEEIATRAVMQELRGTGMIFSGVGR